MSGTMGLGLRVIFLHILIERFTYSVDTRRRKLTSFSVWFPFTGAGPYAHPSFLTTLRESAQLRTKCWIMKYSLISHQMRLEAVAGEEELAAGDFIALPRNYNSPA
jgi:hypothetical protein